MQELAFLPFGAQYYRAPTPLREDFARDLAGFAAHGFNTIKIWLQWRWNNPEPGRFCFDDMRELLDEAQKNGLKVVINIICDVAPAWFYRQYPDAVMRYADGRPLNPQTTACRQIGGTPGPCYHHPEGRTIRRELIEAAARELGGHPALAVWDLWNEPELTCGVKRQPVQEDMVCYCENSRREFLQWLENKYGGVEGVNHAWGRNYQHMDEVELPRCGQTIQDMIDWRLFFAETLAEECRMRAEAVKKYDRQHPVMVHTVPMPYFNMVNACSDEYLLAQHCDMFGNSLGSSPFSATTATTAAYGKWVMNAEIHAIGGDTFNRPSVPTFNEMKRHIFIPLGRGVKGFLFWQYRPERMGLESPAWGLTDLAGGDTPWLVQAKQINDALQRQAEGLLRCKPVPARIAILNASDAQLFTWCITGGTELYYQCVKGLFDILYEANFPVDIISEHQLTADALARYACVLLPFPYYLQRRHADALKAWVADGGTLISEALFGGYTAETNLHATTLPGHGFDEVFGLKEGGVLTASSFHNAYGGAWATQNDRDEIEIRYADGTARGYFFRETLDCGTAEPIGQFADGTAAGVNRYGKGVAVMLGSLLGACYARKRDPGTAAFIRSLVERYTALRPTADCRGHADWLLNGEDAAYCVIQAAPGGGELTLSSSWLRNTAYLENLITGERYAVEGGTAVLPTEESGIEAYALRRV